MVAEVESRETSQEKEEERYHQEKNRGAAEGWI